MEGDDELIFSGKYKDFEYSIAFDLSKANEEDVAYALSLIGEKIEKQAFFFSGIDLHGVDSGARKIPPGLGAVVKYLNNVKPGDLKNRLLKSAGKKTLLPAAESFFFNLLLKRARVNFKITPSLIHSSLIRKEENPEGDMVMIGKYKNWVSIRKLTINNKTQPWEVSAILSNMNFAIIHKCFDFVLGDKMDELNAFVPKKGRKSYGNLAKALDSLDLPAHPTESAYVVLKTFESMGYMPYAAPQMLMKEHPSVKPPKVKKRKPKG